MADGVELLSPAGDFSTALAAFDAGADAVYCGLGDFSARAFAVNLSIDDLRLLVRVAHARGRKVYVTFNTLVDEADLETALDRLADLADIGPDALIVQDLGIARLVRRYFPNLALHASTQLVAHNLEGVLALRDLGFTRVVLARELSLAEISSISKRCGDMELECFIHGALCYSLSGLCLFSALEKGRSGNRGACAYCCRLGFETEDHRRVLPFSMKDLRLGEDVRKLVEAGVVSLKIEGRMKSALYVASVTRYYRQILDKERGVPAGRLVTVADLETVFSRRTTKLRFNGDVQSPVDPSSLGHLGTNIGTVKRVTKDREGRAWVRFHTARALERHDGLQFSVPVEGLKPFGFGISEMRTALSRSPVFEVAAGTDIEVLLPDMQAKTTDGAAGLESVRPGATVYCSMSNAVKRMFPTPSIRPSDYAGEKRLDITVRLMSSVLTAETVFEGQSLVARQDGQFAPAKDSSRTREAIEKAFAKLGGTDYCLGQLTVEDPDRLFAPAHFLNDLRRDLIEQAEQVRARVRHERIAAALVDEPTPPAGVKDGFRSIRLRVGQQVPAGPWDEIVVVVNGATSLSDLAFSSSLRLALPIYTAEPEFNRLRTMVKRCLRAGFEKWEASDLATLRMLNELGVRDITVDWSLYAFNSHALAALAELGVRRFVASPENTRENLQYLAESGYAVEFLTQQSTPLFISLNQPAVCACDDLVIYRRDGLWITTKPSPRTFNAPKQASQRIDLSWDPPEETL